MWCDCAERGVKYLKVNIHKVTLLGAKWDFTNSTVNWDCFNCLIQHSCGFFLPSYFIVLTFYICSSDNSQKLHFKVSENRLVTQ